MIVQSDHLGLVEGLQCIDVWQEFEHDSVAGWMERSWVSVCSWATLLYLLFVVSVRTAMRDK